MADSVKVADEVAESEDVEVPDEAVDGVEEAKELVVMEETA